LVHGIDKYREYFSDYTDHYVLIGGVACDILMNDIDMEFRATKDFDVVLIAEAFSEDFFKILWQFFLTERAFLPACLAQQMKIIAEADSGNAFSAALADKRVKLPGNGVIDKRDIFPSLSD
jgi:hypothetical protein